MINESGYSGGYSSLIYNAFRKSLDYCVLLNYVEKNVSLGTKSIQKGKGVVPYWTKEEFEKTLSVICINNLYEHMCFVMLWLYYTTGIRVSEGLALTWSDVDMKNKKLRIHGTLEWTKGKNKQFKIKPYTKTISGLRTISLDNDTIEILKIWKERQFKNEITDFIISYSNKPLVRSTVNRIVTRYALLANVKKYNPKD